jgi:hypothetical protein
MAVADAVHRFFYFDIMMHHFEGRQSGDHCLLVLEQLVFAHPERVTAPHAPQPCWGDGNGAAFVLVHTYSAYGTTSFEGYIELKQGLRQDAFQEALLHCVGGDVRAALLRINVTASSDDAAGLRRLMSPRYNGEIYFMHGRLCPAVARALRAQILAGSRCGGGAQGLVVRTLMRALVLEDAEHAQCSI